MRILKVFIHRASERSRVKAKHLKQWLAHCKNYVNIYLVFVLKLNLY